MAKADRQDQPAQGFKASAEEAPLLELNKLALKHGHTFHRRGKDGEMHQTVPAHDSPFKRTHLAADALHGWTKYEFQTSEKILLSDADYLAAIESAKNGKTHAPANKRGA